MIKEVENKYFLANIATISLGCGVIKLIREVKEAEEAGESFLNICKEAYEIGLGITSNFPQILTEKGVRRIERWINEFKKVHFQKITFECLLSLNIELLERLLKKKKKSGEKVIFGERRDRINTFISKLLELNIFLDRDLMGEEEIVKGIVLADEWEKILSK